MKKVIFVREGKWGIGDENDYKSIISLFAEILEKEKRLARLSSQEETKAAEIKIVDSVWELKKIIMTEVIDVIVFFSRGMQKQAHELIDFIKENRKYTKGIKIIILTGLIPSDEIIYLPKQSYLITKLFSEAVLDWPVDPEIK